MTSIRLRDPDELDPVRARYVKMMIHAATTGKPPRPSPMDAGLALCDVLAGREVRELVVPQDGDFYHDASGHGRAFYAPLTLYSQLRALLQVPDLACRHMDAVEKGLETASRVEDAYGPGLPLWTEPLQADVGDGICELAWYALSSLVGQQVLQKRLHASERLRHVLPGICERQLPDGSLLHFSDTQDTNVESWWHHELVLLHALAASVAITGDARVLAAVRRAVRFHHAETQPDHATSQPWAIHAFLLDLDTLPTADLMLLAANINQPEGLDAVSRILLADAAVCMLAVPGDNS